MYSKLISPFFPSRGRPPLIPPSVAFLFCNLLLATAAFAMVYTVDDDGPADFSSIQDAINAAGSGDIVSVMPGTYDEIITMADGVTVTGSGPGQSVIISSSPNDNQALVNFVGLSSSAVLEGFEIRGYNRSGIGGGFLVENGGGTVRNNKFVENNATYGGGGGLVNATAIVRDNLFKANLSAYRGAGIYIEGGHPVLISNIFQENRGTRRGGALYILDSTAEITNNTINSNRASNTPWEGGGIYVGCSTGDVPILSNNLITSNGFGEGNTGVGGGIFIEAGCPSYAFAYNGMWNNFSPQLAGIFDDSILDSETCSNMDIPGVLEPYLSSPGGDFHLRPGAEPIDQGFLTHDYCLSEPECPCPAFSSPITEPAEDFEGTLRPQAGPVPGEVQGLRFRDQAVLEWDPLAGSFVAFNIYRGLLSELSGSFYGTCETATDIAQGYPFDWEFNETEFPPIGEGFFYLITGEEHFSCSWDMGAFEFNGESELGLGPGGMDRPNNSPCQLTCCQYQGFCP